MVPIMCFSDSIATMVNSEAPSLEERRASLTLALHTKQQEKLLEIYSKNLNAPPSPSPRSPQSKSLSPTYHGLRHRLQLERYCTSFHHFYLLLLS